MAEKNGGMDKAQRDAARAESQRRMEEAMRALREARGEPEIKSGDIARELETRRRSERAQAKPPIEDKPAPAPTRKRKWKGTSLNINLLPGGPKEKKQKPGLTENIAERSETVALFRGLKKQSEKISARLKKFTQKKTSPKDKKAASSESGKSDKIREEILSVSIKELEVIKSDISGVEASLKNDPSPDVEASRQERLQRLQQKLSDLEGQIAALEGDTSLLPTPETEIPDKDKQEIEQELADTTPKERVGLLKSLLGIGYKVEKWKNEGWAKAFGAFSKGKKSDKLLIRTMGELQDTFKQKAKDADKRAKEVAKGSGSWKTTLMSPALLAGNIYKYGRMVLDFTGKTVMLPYRYVTMAGMAVSGVSEAAKEARLKTEEVSKKTRDRFKTSDEAADEAWRIYERAQESINDSSGINMSTEALQNIYVKELPADLLRRLEQDPAVAAKWTQRFAKWDIKKAVIKLDKDLKKIEADKKLTPEQKEQKKLKLLNGIQWRNALKDYDRMITELGTVDGIATAAIYARSVGRGLVAGTLVGGVVKIGLEKLFERIHESSETFEAATGATEGVKQVPDSVAVKPDTSVSPDTTKIAPPAQPDSTATGITQPPAAPASAPAEFKVGETLQVKPEAVVGKGQGIEHVFQKQGYSGAEAHELAKKFGYVGADGEIRVRQPGWGYTIEGDKVIETDPSGKIVEVRTPQSGYEGGGEPLENEYVYKKEVPATEAPVEVDKPNAPAVEQVITDKTYGVGLNLQDRLNPEDVLVDKPNAPAVEQVITPETQQTPVKKIQWGEQATSKSNVPPIDNRWAEVEAAENRPSGNYVYGPTPYGAHHFNSWPEQQMFEGTHGLGRELYSQISKIYENNIDKLYEDFATDETGDSLVKRLLDYPANTYLDDKGKFPDDKYFTPMEKYLERIYKVMGEDFRPHGRSIFGRKAETVGEFVKRALIEAAKQGKLEQLTVKG